MEDIDRFPELCHVHCPIRPAQIVCTHLPDRFRKAAHHLRALTFLTDLCLIRCELVPNRGREARQPNERIDKPNQLARLFWLVGHGHAACEIQCISGIIMSTTMVHVRVDEKTKQRATKTLAAMGMSVSDAVRMLLVARRRGEGPALRCEGPQRDHCEGDARRRQGPGQAPEVRRRTVQGPGNLVLAEPDQRHAVPARCETRSEARQGHGEVARGDTDADRGMSVAAAIQGPSSAAGGSISGTATSNRIGC